MKKYRVREGSFIDYARYGLAGFVFFCKDIMDYWFKEALNDINTTSFALKGNKVDEKRFAEIVENYGNLRWREEYERSKNRKTK